MKAVLHKKFTLAFATVALLLTCSFVGFDSTQTADGKTLYKHNCQQCHGSDGTCGMFGAKNLKKSKLADAAIRLQIKNGKGFMPSFDDKIKAAELETLITYVKSLRKI